MSSLNPEAQAQLSYERHTLDEAERQARAALTLATALLTFDGYVNRPGDGDWDLMEVDRGTWEAWMAAARRVLDEGAP